MKDSALLSKMTYRLPILFFSSRAKFLSFFFLRHFRRVDFNFCCCLCPGQNATYRARVEFHGFSDRTAFHGKRTAYCVVARAKNALN